MLGFLAGAYIAFGGQLAIVVGKAVNTDTLGAGIGKLVFAGVFPAGIMLVGIAGSELFTGNCGVITPSRLAGESRRGGLLKHWAVVYIGNSVGSVFVAYFLAHATGITTSEPWLGATQSIAVGKVTKSFWPLFWRGVGCNWLACLAVILAIASDDIVGKIWGLWFPIMAFVAIGFEHSVANMFFVPLGIFNGASVTWGQFLLNNLLPVTLGNIVGGAGLVGVLYWYVYIRD